MSDLVSSVIVPWDFSEHAKQTLRFALDNIPPANVHVICVLEIPNPYAPDFVTPYHTEEKAIRECEKDFIAQAQPGNYPGLTFVAAFGDPAEEIVQFAKQQNASMILMSTHGRSGIKRLMMGSVAEKVLRISNCPVMILPNSLVAA